MAPEGEVREKLSEAVDLANCDPDQHYRDFLVTRTLDNGEDEYTFEKIDFHSNILTSLNKVLTEQLRSLYSDVSSEEDEEGDDAFRELLQYSVNNYDISPTPVQYVEVDEIPNNSRFRSVLNDLTISDKTDFTNPEDIEYQTFRVKNNMQPKLVAFKLFTTRQIVGRNKEIKVILSGQHEYNRVEEDPVALPETFDAVYYDGLVFILKPHKFEKLFDYFESYQEAAEDIFEYIVESDLNIADFDRFKSSVTNSNSQLRRMKRIHERGRYTDLSRGLVEQMVDEFDVAVEVREDEGGTWQLEITDFRKINEVLNLFDDDFVVSGIDALSGSDELQKYLAKGDKEPR